jgi:hypothetical protein
MAAGKAPSKTGSERRTPSDAERQLIAQVNEAKKRGGFDNYDPAKQLKSALDAAKTAARNRIADLEHEIRTREKIVKEKTPLKPDAELAALHKRRDELRAIHGTVFPKTMTFEQKAAAVEKGLDRAIAALEADLKAGRIGKKPKPQPASTPAIEAKRARLESLRAHRQALRDAANPKLSTEEKRTLAYRRHLEKKLADLNRRIEEKDFSKKEVNRVKPDEESIRMKAEIKLKKEKFREIERQTRRAQLRGLEKAFDVTKEVLNLSRASKTAFDLGSVFRQAGFDFFGHPIQGVKRIPDAVKAFYRRDHEMMTREQLNTLPYGEWYEPAGLDLQSSEGALTHQEETFYGVYQAHVPGVAGSGRAFVVNLNQTRAERFNLLMASLTRYGEPTLEEAKHIARFVNISTGRGQAGRYSQHLTGAALVFFAPRYVLSRFQLAFGVPLFGGTKRTRGVIAQEYARSLAGMATFYGLVSMAGNFLGDDDDKPVFEFNPLSSEFGKIRIGETVVDPMAGLGQVTTFTSRMIRGKTKMSTGEIVPIRGKGVPWGGQTTWGAITDFSRFKFAPVPSAVINTMAMQDPVGNEYDSLGQAAATEAVMMPVPISFLDVYEAAKAPGITKKTMLPLAAIFGMGVNRYMNATKERFAEKIAAPRSLKGRRDDGSRFDRTEEMDQIVSQAKKFGHSEEELVDAAIDRWAKEGKSRSTIRDRIGRLRSRF